MNFLNQAAKTANKGAQGGAMGNPFINKVQGVPSAPTAPTASTAPVVPSAPKAPTIPNVKPLSGVKPGALPKLPGAKPGVLPKLPGVKPVVPAASVPAPETKAEQVAQEEVNAPAEKVEEAKQEVKQEVEQEVEQEVQQVQEAAEPAQEAAEPKQEEKKAKSTRKTTKVKTKTKAKEEAKEEIKEEVKETAAVEVTYTEVSFAKAVQSIKSNFVDEEWDKFRTSVEEKLSSILIDSGLSKVQIIDVLAQVSALRDEISSAYFDTKTLFESLTNKEEGLMDRVKRLNCKGSNSEERKLSGMIAVMNYKSKEGDTINLYELLDETRDRYNFLRGIMETIEFKKSVLLTMLSAVKNDK